MVTGEVLILLLSDRLVSVPLTLTSQLPLPAFRLIQQQLAYLSHIKQQYSLTCY